MDIPSPESVALLVFVSMVVLGLGGFFAFADQDYRLRHTDTTVSIGLQDPGRDFESLDAQQRQIFEEATEPESYVSEDPFNFPARVQRNDTYYDFQYTRNYDWTDASTAFPAFTFLGGFFGVVALLGRNVR